MLTVPLVDGRYHCTRQKDQQFPQRSPSAAMILGPQQVEEWSWVFFFLILFGICEVHGKKNVARYNRSFIAIQNILLTNLPCYGHLEPGVGSVPRVQYGWVRNQPFEAPQSTPFLIPPSRSSVPFSIPKIPLHSDDCSGVTMSSKVPRCKL